MKTKNQTLINLRALYQAHLNHWHETGEMMDVVPGRYTVAEWDKMLNLALNRSVDAVERYNDIRTPKLTLKGSAIVGGYADQVARTLRLKAKAMERVARREYVTGIVMDNFKAAQAAEKVPAKAEGKRRPFLQLASAA